MPVMFLPSCLRRSAARTSRAWAPVVGVGAENDSGPVHQHRRGDHPACPPADLAGGSGGTLAVVAARGVGPPTAPGTILTPAVAPLARFLFLSSCIRPHHEKAVAHRRRPEHPGWF